jgi:predicted metalloprotease
MPIEFDDRRVDVSRVDDRRGRGSGGGGLAIGGGAGVVGLILVVVFQLLGGDPSQLQLPADSGVPGQSQGQQPGESRAELEQRCNSQGALERDTDCRLIKEFTIADAVWSEEFARRGLAYQSPGFVFFSGSTRTGCGQASASVGPFYCPPDQEIFFELTFLEQLQSQFGAQGEFAQAYIVAHEFGHHLQTVLGTEPRVRAAQQRDPGQANLYSIALELQADCYAGVWANLADKRSDNGIALTQDNITEAVGAAQAVGDDRIQEKVQGRVDPESWTHGSAEQRKTWFLTGLRSGTIDACNTFGG